MKVVDHPSLEGVKCREDGAVFVPAARGHEAHWTFGSTNGHGYLRVCIARKTYRVHRLIAEAFHGPCPPGKDEVDHTDRNRSNNKPENLRWVSHVENCRNMSTNIKGMEDVVSPTVDKNAYMRALYANSPEFREKKKARNRAYRANDPEFREKQKARNRAYRAKKKEAA